MNDRELLELAAKAAGIECNQIPLFGGAAHVFENGVSVGLSKTDGAAWNPLLDDGDALRLAVKLGLHVLPGCARDSDGNLSLSDANEDVYAATRDAIVMAAAEIGRAMP